jgi:hypothetical protein
VACGGLLLLFDNFILMKKTDDYMLSRIMWKAGKQGIYKRLNGYTFFFNELPESIKTYLKSNLNEDLSGTPVIFFTKPSNQWTLLCTRQVVGYAGEDVFYIDFQDISEIGRGLLNKNKLLWDELSVTNKQNKNYVFHTCDGYAHNILYNILLMCCCLVD